MKIKALVLFAVLSISPVALAADWIQVGTVTTLTWTSTGLTVADIITVKVAARNAIGQNGPDSDPATSVLIVTPGSVGKPIEGFSGITRAGNQLNWRWTAPTSGATPADYIVFEQRSRFPIPGCGQPGKPELTP